MPLTLVLQAQSTTVARGAAKTLFDMPTEILLRIFGLAIGMTLKPLQRKFNDYHRTDSRYLITSSHNLTVMMASQHYRPNDHLRLIMQTITYELHGAINKDFLLESYCSESILTAHLSRDDTMYHRCTSSQVYRIENGSFQMGTEINKYIVRLGISGAGGAGVLEARGFVFKVQDIVLHCPKLAALVVSVRFGTNVQNRPPLMTAGPDCEDTNEMAKDELASIVKTLGRRSGKNFRLTFVARSFRRERGLLE